MKSIIFISLSGGSAFLSFLCILCALIFLIGFVSILFSVNFVTSFFPTFRCQAR